ncbi:MAG TPA: toll/interleukin-1 receptor domain-containing protein, partial [Acetobacteraceae bacterium]|nr:toll/interleukin-1 receptor domain-containing protein [Acetobacteraceae bacterium]
MAAKVFISHSSVDAWVARQIGQTIQALGASIFLDETEIAAGDDFMERILNTEPGCSELLVLLTPWGIKRPYVLFEISCFRHS